MSDNVSIKEKQQNAELSLGEQSKIAVNVKKHNRLVIPNVGDFLRDSFSKIDGFDYRWNSLITNNPLLFEDIDYLRIKDYVNHTITEEEIQAYKEDKLSEVYGTLENMLICNLQYYDRIMSFCTMVFCHYIRLEDGSITSEYMKNLPYILSMTPTQIWCCAMTGPESTEWELEYAWKFSKKPIIKYRNPEKSLLEQNWKFINKNVVFTRFVEYRALVNGTSGFRSTFIKDITPNNRLSRICAKFTKTFSTVTEDQLQGIEHFCSEITNNHKQLYDSIYACMLKMFNYDDKNFSIFVFNTEFFINSNRFSMRVFLNEKNKNLTKEYMSNAYECLNAEFYLKESIEAQIKWARTKVTTESYFERDLMIKLLHSMISGSDKAYKKIICVKRMNEYGTVSKVHFKGSWNNVCILEDYIVNNEVKNAKKGKNKVVSNHSVNQNKVYYGFANAAQYLIDRGYFVFGTEEDVNELMSKDLSAEALIEHYSNYCVPIMNHMKDVINEHQALKLDITEVRLNGIEEHRLNNDNIMETNLKTRVNPKSLMLDLLNKNKDKLNNKSYYYVINNG